MCPLFLSFFLFCFLGPYLQHTDVPRLGVEADLQLPGYTTATATQDPSRVCDLHHSSRQHWMLNPLSKARDQTHNLTDTSWVLNPLSHSGNSGDKFFFILILFTKLGSQLGQICNWGLARKQKLENNVC